MTDAGRTIRFANADMIVAWDAAADRHYYLPHGDMVIRGNTIIALGRHSDAAGHNEPVDETVDCTGRMLLPGTVNIHTHASAILENKSLLEETSSRLMGSTVLFEWNRLIRMDPGYKVPKLEAALGEVMKAGCTTVVDLAYGYDGWIDTLARSGLRACAGAQYVDGLHATPDGHTMAYEWNLEGGRRGFDVALKAVDQALAHPSGRLFAMLGPGQVDTCGEELLRDSKAEADRRRIPITTHCSQSGVEFFEMVKRHGKSPAQWLESLGFLGPTTTLGHAIFLDHHPWLHWTAPKRDLDVLAATGTHVAHCPWVQFNNGRSLQSFRTYREHGVNVGIGTDSFPLNMWEEMRWALIMGRVAEGWKQAVTTHDIFYAATIGGAKALGRDDIGRLAPGAKADMAVVDLNHWTVQPGRDPLRAMMFHAQERPVRDVWCDGAKIVEDGQSLTLDIDAAHDRLQDGFATIAPKVAGLDWAGRTIDQAFPTSLPTVDRV
ncbi:MAG: amidohydrolase family protein [Alphaproteobacteria bacterium]